MDNIDVLYNLNSRNLIDNPMKIRSLYTQTYATKIRLGDLTLFICAFHVHSPKSNLRSNDTLIYNSCLCQPKTSGQRRRAGEGRVSGLTSLFSFIMLSQRWRRFDINESLMNHCRISSLEIQQITVY